jgi:SPP1 gp7 family putative phage head morphogenesis protein
LKTKFIELPPIKETTDDYERLEATVRELWKKNLYLPLLKLLGLPSNTLKNARYDLAEALRSGRITYYRGQFSGRFSSATSRELQGLGARWDRRTGTYRLPQTSLPQELRAVIAASERQFRAKIAGIDKALTQILPEEIADKLHATKIFDASLWKVQKEFEANVKNITVAPKLTDAQRTRIAGEWNNNMKLWIKDWTAEEIQKLRGEMQKTIMAGNRYESAVKTIQKSYGVSERKAKFLARQETGLLMAKFKETRYSDAGIMEYKWGCVAGSANHPVRPWHKALEGKIFRWDDPPVTTKPGDAVRRNNPGEDYNCRCFARPIVRVKK